MWEASYIEDKLRERHSINQKNMTLNKEQSFLVHEFIRKHSEERVWETQDQLYKLISETLAASTFQVEEEIGMNN